MCQIYNSFRDTIAAIDFFTVPTATFRVLFVFIVVSPARRRVLHFNVTAHPMSEWTGQQIVEAFPEVAEAVSARHLLRDRNQIYGGYFRQRVQGMGLEEILAAPASPRQNRYAERLIGTIRRECLDHMIVLGESHLRSILKSYFGYYHRSRTHLSLAKDAPEPRAVQSAQTGEVFEIDEVGGLHHRYERRAA